MTIYREFARFAALAAVVLIGAESAAARTPFDGNWSVSIWTDRGGCDRGYRYELRIANGRVSYGGEGSFEVSGRVDGRGRVQVRVSRGNQSANGSGRLGARHGRGTWRGQSSASACSGWWEAERR